MFIVHCIDVMKADACGRGVTMAPPGEEKDIPVFPSAILEKFFKLSFLSSEVQGQMQVSGCGF